MTVAIDKKPDDVFRVEGPDMGKIARTLFEFNTSKIMENLDWRSAVNPYCVETFFPWLAPWVLPPKAVPKTKPPD